MMARHRTTEELLAGLASVQRQPRNSGALQLIVRRPAIERREELSEATLSNEYGLAGDTWHARGSRHTPDGSAERARQITLMSAAAIQLFSGDKSIWSLAGDQLYVDFDISVENLPPGAQLRIGGATLSISEEPHTGCAKFAARFGRDASRLLLTEEGKRLRLRGVNASVVEGGTIRVGDEVVKVGGLCT
jgi:MOSC domain-containing protein YiiM